MIGKLFSTRWLPALVFFIALIGADSVSAQRYTISGHVRDGANGEALIGAGVYELNRKTGTATNRYGFYSITLPEDSVTLVFSYVGYNKHIVRLHLNEDVRINIDLEQDFDLEEFVIIEDRIDRIEQESRMSTIKIPVEQVRYIPALLGEADVIKSIQMLPGVQSGSEGSSGLYVRGGGPDQNLILLDEAPVYNPSHLFGFFSVFNPDAINSIELIKGGFPARYGGRTSSVLDMTMREGNMKNFSGTGGIGIIASRFTIEGPIIEDRMSFLFSGRRSYLDLLTRPITWVATAGEESFGYYFYDLNAKINYRLTDRDRVYLSAYRGKDDFGVSARDRDYEYEDRFSFNLGWQNITTTLRWNREITNQLFSNLSLIYSQFGFYTDFSSRSTEDRFARNPEYEESLVGYNSGIRDWRLKSDFDYRPDPNHHIRFGFQAANQKFNPGITRFHISNPDDPAIDTTFGNESVFANKFSLYAEDDIDITEEIKVNAGLHYSGYHTGTSFYHSLQPRISGRYLLGNNWSVKASYAHMTQYIHLLANSAMNLPTDLWMPVTDVVPPQYSRQYAAGVARSMFDNLFEVSIEGYYKTMKNLIAYKEGHGWLNSSFSDWQESIEVGNGTSYGAEFFIQKKTGNTTGWIGYTLSWTNRQFENINFGEPFPYKYDRRHDIAFVIAHRFSDRFSLNVNWVYGTGNAISLPIARYRGIMPDSGFETEINYYEGRNGFRMPAYHRLDVGLNFFKETRWGERTWTFGAYNAYNRKNPFFLYNTTNRKGEPIVRQVSLFPVLPAVVYNFTF